MAGTYLRRPLSASTDGRGILIAATATAGTTIHTAQASVTLVDVLTLYAYNSSTTQLSLTLEWGGVTAPNDNQVYPIPGGMVVPVVADQLLRNGLLVRGFATTTNLIVVYGYVTVES